MKGADVTDFGVFLHGEGHLHPIDDVDLHLCCLVLVLSRLETEPGAARLGDLI
jgi:hypothetical protein